MKKAVKTVLLTLVAMALPVQAMTIRQYNAVMNAVENRDLEMLKKIRKASVDLNTPLANGQTPLCETVLMGDYEGYEMLISQGASPYVACMRTLPEGTVDSFYASQPSAHSYYEGRMDSTHPVKSWGPADEKKWSFPIAGVGEVLLGGVAVGAAFAFGHGSSGSGHVDPGWVAPLDLKASTFETAEYKGSKLGGVNFLGALNASSAYARGYTGYKVNRNSKGELIGSGQNAITNEKIKVVVFDDGVWTDHPKLMGNVSITEGKVYNFAYGVCSENNKQRCWQYDSTKQVATLIYNYGSSNEEIQRSVSMTLAEWASYQATYTNYVWNPLNVTPSAILSTASDNNHGTHVAGIIGAEQTDSSVGMMGVAYNAAIVPVKVEADIKGEWFAGLSNVMTLGADIINISLGLEDGVRYSSEADAVQKFRALANDINYQNVIKGLNAAMTNNKIIVLAAGNYAHVGTDPYDPQLFAVAPLDSRFNGTDDPNKSLKNLFLTVISVDEKDGAYSLASYSPRCGVTKDYCIAAPGGEYSNQIYSTIRETDGDYGYGGKYGTSMATPMVSGALVILKSAFPHLSNQQVVEILLETATDLGEEGVDEVYGHGLVNLEAATNPVGLTKLALTTETNGTAASTQTSSASVPASLSAIAKIVPSSVIVLDKYDRAFSVPTSAFVAVSRRENKLEGRFKSFMAGHEKVVQPTENFEMRYSERYSNRSSMMQKGAVSMKVQPTETMAFQTFYTEDTTTNGGQYFERLMMSPYSKMKEAWGGRLSFNLGSKWEASMSGQVGQNGYVDSDELNDMETNRMSVVESSIVYKGMKNLSLKLMTGLSEEKGSTLGLWGRGAFKTGNSKTSFVGAGMTAHLTDNFTVEGMYYYGTTKAASEHSLLKMSELKSDSFALTAAWQMDENRLLGMQFVSPLRIRKGRATMDLPVGRDAYQNIVYRETVEANLKPSAREYDVGFYYTDALAEDVLFQTEFGVRLNPDHMAGASPDWRALIGLQVGM